MQNDGLNESARKAVEILKAKGLTLTVAESCTGGMITGALVGVPGVSEVLVEGLVTYANSAKLARLNVSAETLERDGAVSARCAEEMARGAQRSADIGISTTGIAGPGGGSADKPVGLVYMGFCRGDETYSIGKVFHGARNDVRRSASIAALEELIRMCAEI